jgi:hypothetical protein
MSLTSAVLALAILMSIGYVAMAFAASSHVRPEKRDSRGVNRLFALTLWWPFYTDLYDETGLRLCLYGRLLLFMAVVAYVAHAILASR